MERVRQMLQEMAGSSSISIDFCRSSSSSSSSSSNMNSSTMHLRIHSPVHSSRSGDGEESLRRKARAARACARGGKREEPGQME